MMRRILVAAFLLIASAIPSFAASEGFTVPTCGTLAQPYTTGGFNAFAIDVNGNTCIIIGGNGFPAASTPITASATGTTAATATLASVAGKTTYICGFEVTTTGATAAGAGTVVVSGTVGGSLNYVIPQVVITANNQAPLVVPFEPCIPASAAATPIVVTATLGAGTTNTAASATGFQQ